MSESIDVVFTATQTARAVRQLLEAHEGRPVSIGVIETDSGFITVEVRHVSRTAAVCTMTEGHPVIVSLGEPDDQDTTFPTIIVGRSFPG